MPITLTISQQPNGVLFSGTGTINTASFLGKTSQTWASTPLPVFDASNGYVNGGVQSPYPYSTIKYYSNLFFPIGLGFSNQLFFWTEVINNQNNTNYFAIGTFGGFLTSGIGIKSNYTSGSHINFSFLIPNQTYGTLGIYPASNYRTWTGSGGVTESLTINVVPQQPNVTITISESYGNVYANVGGNLDLNWEFNYGLGFVPGNSISSSTRAIQFGDDTVNFKQYAITTIPQNFGNTSRVANIGSTNTPFRVDNQGFYIADDNYSGSIYTSMTFTGTTIAGMGLIPGSYNYYGPGNRVLLNIVGPPTTPTQTATNTPTPTVTPTNTKTPTVTPTNTPTVTNTPTETKTPTPTPTITETVTPTVTQTPTSTETPTPTPTVTETVTPTATNTPTPTETPT